jgi:hypothetical protein
MPAFYEIRCLPSGTRIEFPGSRGNHYELEDGSRIDVRSEPVWCRRCGGYVEGEVVEPLEQIDRELAELRDPKSEAYRMTQDSLAGPDGEFRRHYIRLVVQRRRWRECRHSPPRCLQCGSTDLIRLPCGEEVPNPCGPGVVILNVIGLCSTWFNNWSFTAEGQRIPTDARPTYWKLRE